MDILKNPGFSVVQSAKANYLCVQCDDEDQIDSIALQVMLEDRPPFLMPIQLRMMNDQRTFNFQLASGVALKHNLDGELSKNEYLKLASSLLAPFLTCREWFLDYHNICIDPQFIIRDKQTGGYLFIYIPDNSFGSSDAEIIEFFRNTLNRVEINDNAVFQNRMMRYLLNSDVSLYELNDVIKREIENSNSGLDKPKTQPRETPVRNEEPVNTVKKPEPITVGEPIVGGSSTAPRTVEIKTEKPQKPESKLHTAKPAKAEPQKSSKQGIFDFLLGKKKDDDPLADLTAPISSAESSDSSDLDELFGGKKSKKPEVKKSSPFSSMKQSSERVKPLKQQPEPTAAPKVTLTPKSKPAPEISVDTGYIASEETNIGGSLEVSNELRLIDSKFEGAPEVISLDFKSNRAIIGRRNSETKPDIEFPESCKGVGRRHACISRTADGQYKISDLGSTYGTLLDGQRLVPNLEYDLKDGMQLVFVEQKSIRYRVVLPNSDELI